MTATMPHPPHADVYSGGGNFSGLDAGAHDFGTAFYFVIAPANTGPQPADYSTIASFNAGSLIRWNAR
jgi:hypothetical protein